MDYRDFVATLLCALVFASPLLGHGVEKDVIPKVDLTVGNPATLNPITDVAKDNPDAVNAPAAFVTKRIELSVKETTSKPSTTTTTTTTEKPTENPSTNQNSANSTHSQTTSTTTRSTTTTTQTTTKPITTTVGAKITTPKKPENCMKKGAVEFQTCLEKLGENAMKYITSLDLQGFLDDICDPELSKPHVECIKRHFTECPDFLNRPEVIALQFGPYHIKDIHHFDTIDQMCRCSPGLVCINKLLETKRAVNLTIVNPKTPWRKMPNFKSLCAAESVHYIGCIRQNLRQCQTALNRRYKDEFTYNDAQDLKGMYDFIQRHCDTVNTKDFETQYKCINDVSRSPEMHACVRKADRLTKDRQTCAVRECVKRVLEPRCDEAMLPLYIDAINIYTHSTTRLLNFPCSSATEIGLSIGTIIFTFLLVLYF